MDVLGWEVNRIRQRKEEEGRRQFISYILLHLHFTLSQILPRISPADGSRMGPDEQVGAVVGREEDCAPC